MSRSYKKNPIVKDHNSGRIGKKFANKKVRNVNTFIPNGNAYKKLFCSYNIHDYISRQPYSDCIKEFESELSSFINGGIEYDPRNEKYSRWYDYNNWAKYYKRK